MEKIVKNSIVADRGSIVSNSKNETKISINKIRSESAIISFIVGTLSSIIASYVFEHWLK